MEKHLKQCLRSKKSLEFKSKIQVVKGHQTENQSTIVYAIIKYRNHDITVHEEVRVYDAPGMVCQLGGAISLFTGISFFAIFIDVLDFIKTKMIVQK